MNRIVIYLGITYLCASQVHVAHSAGKLLFHSGFEANTELIKESRGWIDITGADASVSPPNNWLEDFGRRPLGRFRFQYAGGDVLQRRVTIERDPTDPANRVLRYWMKHVNVDPHKSYGGKGRIQANVAGNTDLRDFYYSVRLYFHADWKHLQDWQERMGWFILAEFWNNGDWTGQGYPFRIHLTISNDPDRNRPLRFGVGGQVKEKGKGWQTIWHRDAERFALPIAEWMTAEVYLKEGKGRTGRFYFAITRRDGSKTVLFDVRNTTHHPDDPNPDGYTRFNPMKMYTHNRNIHRVRSQGGALQILWDDFELWTNRHP